MSTLAQMRQPCWTLVKMAAVALGAMIGTGCGMPATYPAKGKVVFKGGKPVTDGKIQFQSTTDPQMKALGDIDADGSFSLTTHIEAKTARGAPAGTYRVIVELEKPIKVVALPAAYTVESRENEFTIVIEKPGR
jgi:hypothetical protein